MRARATHARTQKSCQGAISIGPVLPRTWTPPGTPRDRDGELDIETFKRGETDIVGGWVGGRGERVSDLEREKWVKLDVNFCMGEIKVKQEMWDTVQLRMGNVTKCLIIPSKQLTSVFL